MSRARLRWTMAGALAVAGIGVPGGAGTVATAEAAPTASSPFAGSYWGPVPGSQWNWPLKVAAGGGVSGSYDFIASSTRYDTRYRGSLRGSVSADGTMSLSVEESWKSFGPPHIGKGDGGGMGGDGYLPPPGSVSYTVRAVVTLDANRNLQGTTDGGATFIWDRL